MANKLTQKQERFALNLFKGLSQRQAWIDAGYSNRYPVQWIDSHACRLADLDKIKARLEEYRIDAKDKTIADVRERQQRLTVFAREDNISSKGTILRGPSIQAIAELNKMEHVYDNKPQYQDNRTINILVQNEESRKGFDKLLEGRRPQPVVVEGEKAQDIGGEE